MVKYVVVIFLNFSKAFDCKLKTFNISDLSLQINKSFRRSHHWTPDPKFLLTALSVEIIGLPHFLTLGLVWVEGGGLEGSKLTVFLIKLINLLTQILTAQVFSQFRYYKLLLIREKKRQL